jgi:hypothetical protein
MEDRRITDQDILSLLKFIGAAEGMHTASTMTTGKVPDPHVAAPLSASSTAPGAKHGADPPPTKTANYHSVSELQLNSSSWLHSYSWFILCLFLFLIHSLKFGYSELHNNI